MNRRERSHGLSPSRSWAAYSGGGPNGSKQCGEHGFFRARDHRFITFGIRLRAMLKRTLVRRMPTAPSGIGATPVMTLPQRCMFEVDETDGGAGWTGTTRLCLFRKAVPQSFTDNDKCLVSRILPDARGNEGRSAGSVPSSSRKPLRPHRQARQRQCGKGGRLCPDGTLTASPVRELGRVQWPRRAIRNRQATVLRFARAPSNA